MRKPVAKRGSVAIVASLALAVALWAWGSSAQGHALLRSADPGFDEVLDSAPELVTLGFTEPVELGFGSVRVLDQQGRRVDRGEARYVSGRQDSISVGLASGLDDGAYTVDWRVISSDSHPLHGAYVFHVGKPGAAAAGGVPRAGEASTGGPVGIAFGALRWVIFSALLALAGAGIFYAAVWRRPRRPWSRSASTRACGRSLWGPGSSPSWEPCCPYRFRARSRAG